MGDKGNSTTGGQNWKSDNNEYLPSSLQESIVACLAFITDTHTARMSQMLDSKWFAEPYSDIVAHCQQYWQDYDKAPGKTHIDDHFSRILDNPDHKDNRTYQRMLRGMMVTSDELNTEYVFSRLNQFAVRQNYTLATFHGGTVIAHAGDTIDTRGFDQIEEHWIKAIEFRKRFTLQPKLCRTIHEWMNLEFEPSRKFLGDVFTARTRTLIAGRTGIGKSLLGMELALSVSNGSSFLHWPGSGEKARIMLIDFELNKELVRDRLATALYRFNPWPDTFHLISQDQSGGIIPPLNTPDGKRFLMQEIEGFQPDGIVYDNLDNALEFDDKFYGAKSISEALPLFRSVTSRDIGQLFLHHAIGEDFYGSKKQGWPMDTIAIMRQPKGFKDEAGKVSFSLNFTKHRNRLETNWSDFQDVDIVFENRQWTSTPSKAKSSEDPDTVKQKSNRKTRKTKSPTVEPESTEAPTPPPPTNPPATPPAPEMTTTAEIIPIREKETHTLNDLAFWCHKHLLDLLEETGEPSVSEQDWKQDCFHSELLGTKSEDRREQSNQHSRFAKAKTKLVNDGLVICVDGMVWSTTKS